MTAMALAVVFAGASIVMAEGDPALTVDTPTEDLATNASRLQVTGTTEPSIHVRVHVVGDQGGSWNNSTSQPDGSFDVQVELYLGLQNITVQAEDLAGNTTNVTRAVIRDITEPDLDLVLEYLNTTAIPYSEEFGAYAVREGRIAINGTYGDDFSVASNITLRINGVPMYIHNGFPYVLYVQIELDQGMNTITVDVTDAAGNRATVSFDVYLDSIPPSLVVITPVEDELTRNATYYVTGETEPLTRLDIMVLISGDTRDYTLTSEEDGTFEASIELFEGIQLIIVKATDAMGNPTTVAVDVTLDTIPPDFVINRPGEEYVVTNLVSYIIVGRMIDEPEARVFILDQEVEHIGVFQLEVVLEEGENLIEVKAVDEAGNEKVVVLTIVRDSIRPTLTVTAPPGDTLYTNDTTVHFEGTVSGAVGVVVQHGAIELDAVLVTGSWEDGEWEYDLELGPLDLDQNVIVVARDEAGNEVQVTVHVVLDIVPPPLSIGGEALSYTNQTTVTIEGTTEEGIESALVNGVEGAVEGGVFSIAVDLDEGLNTFVISVEDEAGNVATDTIEFFLDTVPPTFEIEYPKETDKERAVISGTCAMDVVRVWVNWESIEIENGTFELEVELPEDGKNLFLITFEDRAGNTATETIWIRKGEETPGFGAWFAILGIALMLVVTRRGRRDS